MHLRLVVEALLPPQHLSARRDAQAPSLRPSHVPVRLGALDQPVALELSDAAEHSHCHLSGGTSEIKATECQTVHPHAHVGETFDECEDVHRVAPKPVAFVHIVRIRSHEFTRVRMVVTAQFPRWRTAPLSGGKGEGPSND